MGRETKHDQRIKRLKAKGAVDKIRDLEHGGGQEQMLLNILQLPDLLNC